MMEVSNQRQGERDEEQTNSDIDGIVVDSDATAITGTDQR